MKNIRLDVSYNGSNYCGFQRQKNGLAIQQVIEEAIFKVTGEKSPIFMSGRTDSGVHALCQVVNFHSNTTLPVDKLYIILNQHLPQDIRIMNSLEVHDSFHARKSAKRKTYLYKIYLGKVLPALDYGRVYHYKRNVDNKKMQKACHLLLGEHDFSAFVSSGASTSSTIRTIYDAHIEIFGEYVDFYVTGNGFLYNMVRILLGTLLDVASGKMSEKEFLSLLSGKNREEAGDTMPPYALYLVDVEY